MNNENYNEYYKKIGDNYNKIRLDSKENIENTINIIKSETNISNPNLLDIGCGTGVYGQKLENDNFTVTGIDKSKSQIKQASKIINAICGSATELPFEDSKFDICTMIMMIHQLQSDDRKKAFSESYRVLKKNGKLIIKTSSYEDLKRKFNAVYFSRIFEIDKERYPDIKIIHEELKMFNKIKDIHTSVKVKYDKEDLLNRLRLRRTSNLSMLTDEELKEGLDKIEEEYKDSSIIECNIENTFVIAEK